MIINPKVSAAVVAGALATVVAYAASKFGLDLPDEVVAAVTTLFAFTGGYLRPAEQPTV
jgi:hypothetical protein